MYSREVYLKITRDLCTGIVFENMWTHVLEWYAKLPLCTGMVREKWHVLEWYAKNVDQ